MIEETMYSTMVYYQDTDAGGVVYFANYLKYFEKSWFNYLMSIGISIPEWEEHDTYIMVKTAFVDLLEKLQYGDHISISTTVTDVKNAHFTLNHVVHKKEKMTAKGETKMVCVDRSGKLKRIPEGFRTILTDALFASR